MRHEPRRFLADTNHLSAAAVGALVRLRDKMIISGGRLPDDNRMLARIAQIRNPKTFARLRAEIGIKPLGDGTVTLPEAEKMLTEVKKKQASARTAASERWDRSRAIGSNNNCTIGDNNCCTGGGGNSLKNINPPYADAHQSQSQRQLQAEEAATSEGLSKGQTKKPTDDCVSELAERYGQNEARVRCVWWKISRMVQNVRDPDALLRRWCAMEVWA